MYDRSTLVFPGIKYALLVCCTFKPINLILSKWACFMPGKTKVERSCLYNFFGDSTEWDCFLK